MNSLARANPLARKIYASSLQWRRTLFLTPKMNEIIEKEFSPFAPKFKPKPIKDYEHEGNKYEHIIFYDSPRYRMNLLFWLFIAWHLKYNYDEYKKDQKRIEDLNEKRRLEKKQQKMLNAESVE